MSERRLVEGVDYTVEGGRWVFTAAYLLRRGTCCQNGCRNCPYGFIRPDPKGREPRSDVPPAGG